MYLPPAPCYRLPGVRIFGSGWYQDPATRWDPLKVRMLAKNARLLGPDGRNILVPPCVPGHKDSEDWREYVETDEPAAAFIDPSTVTAHPDPEHPGEVILTADIVNVVPDMAQKIANGQYRTGSIELYDQFRDDMFRDVGPAIRRFAFLGGELPAVRRLRALPMPVPMSDFHRFAERRVRLRVVRTGSRALTCYAEGTAVRQQLYQQIQAAMPGLSQATLDAMSDDALKDLAAQCTASGPTTTGPAVTPTDMADGDGGDDAQRDDLMNTIFTALQSMTTDQLSAVADQLSSMGATATGGDQLGNAASAFAHRHAETLRVTCGQTPKQFLKKFSEIRKNRGDRVAATLLPPAARPVKYR